MADEVPRYLAVQLAHVFQVGFYLIYCLRLSPDVVSVINTPESELSQIQNKKCQAKSKNYNPSIADTVVSNKPIVSNSVPPPA